MKEVLEMGKRRRIVYFVEPESTTRFAMFCVKYLACLSQTLMHSTASIKLVSGNNEEQKVDIRRRVRFEIDMAMILSVGNRFKWTKALKQKLDGNRFKWRVPMMTVVMEMMPEQQLIMLPSCVNNYQLSVQVKERKTHRKREMEEGEREEVRQCIEMLREVVPGGDEEWSIKELMAEVVNYVTCLQFQVAALRSLVSSSSSSDSA